MTSRPLVTLRVVQELALLCIVDVVPDGKRT